MIYISVQVDVVLHRMKCRSRTTRDRADGRFNCIARRAIGLMARTQHRVNPLVLDLVRENIKALRNDIYLSILATFNKPLFGFLNKKTTLIIVFGSKI